MKTITILSQKGGTGKTTLALHLAVAAEQAGETVIVIDLDPQASAMAWKDVRSAETPDVISVTPGRFQKALDAAKEAGVTLTLIDTAPHSQDVSYAAAKAADLVLITCLHGFLDVNAIGTTAELVERAGKAGFVVFNRLHQRAAYGNALTAGQTAQEFEPKGKASEEVAELYAWLHETIKE